MAEDDFPASETLPPLAIGRPPKDPEVSRFYDGKLHALIVERMPELVTRGRLDVKALAAKTGNVRYTVYRWLQQDRLSPTAAASIIRVSSDPVSREARISREDLLPFLLA